MRLRYFGGFAVETDDRSVVVRGRGQEALLLRLALDAGTTVGYRALVEDVWPDDRPEDPRAALQSLASRLRRALPAGSIEAVPGGYRLGVERGDVDLTLFQDLVARARAAPDSETAAALAREALALASGEPWVPEGFDWVVRDLLEDRAHAARLARAGSTGPAAPAIPPRGAEPSIPAALTTLVGRERELALVRSQLDLERLVTLIGPGGAGKTTVALETARSRPGAVVVELAPAAPGEVWAAVAGAVARSIRIAGDAMPASAGPRERALEALAGRSVLLVLDNCEHVSREAAAVSLDLLRAVPGAGILATSREPLGVPGEAFVDLGPLADADAIELFSRRVRAARGTAPDAAEAARAARIARRLDGLPLALELAAAKTRTMAIAEVEAGLDDRFALLAAGPRAADPRHQTLRALIDWSWETLTPGEREALLAAAVFPDGIDAADSGRVAASFEFDSSAFDLLVDRSLLHRSDGRFRMLETVREYGLDRLRGDTREDALRRRAAYALAGAALARDATLRGPAVREGLAWFDANDENLTSALRTCEAASGAPDMRETGVRLVRARLWESLIRERFDALVAGVRSFGDPDGPLDSEPAVVVAGMRLFADAAALLEPPQEDSDALEGLSPEKRLLATQAADAIGDRDGFGKRIARVATAARRHPSELALALPSLMKVLETALAEWDRGTPWWSGGLVIDDAGLDGAPEWTRALVGVMRSAMAQNGGDVATLGRESELALARFRELGDVWGIAMASQMRSEWLMLQGRLEDALDVADASTEGLAGLTSAWDLIQQRSLGIAMLTRLGRIDEARARLRDLESLAREEGSERSSYQVELTAVSLDIAEGDGAAALARLEAVPAHVPGVPDQVHALAASKRAQALLLLGRLDEARAALLETIGAATRSGDQPIQSDVVLTLAWLLADLGRDDDARTALRESVRLRGAVDRTDPAFERVWERLQKPGFSLEAPSATGPGDFAALGALLE